MAEMMMGRSPPPDSAQGPQREPGDTRLRLSALHADDDAGVPAVRDVTLDVRAGEIVGVAAIAGNGQEELVEVLAGQRPRTSGKITVSGRDFAATRAELHDLGVRCLPEEPLRNACVPVMSVAENMAFRAFDRPDRVVMGVFLSSQATARAADRLVREYGIRTPSIHAPIGHLSGGNVQRAVLARELEGEVDVLVAANPCMGLDFAAVSEIHARIRQARDRGAAVLLVSADLDELLALAGRIVVMSEGRVVHETPVGRADVAVIGKFMAGAA
jgi:simple sugar transport system ATP-binding protein